MLFIWAALAAAAASHAGAVVLEAPQAPIASVPSFFAPPTLPELSPLAPTAPALAAALAPEADASALASGPSPRAVEPQEAESADGPGWTRGSFESSAGGRIAFKARETACGAPARVYSGGLALNDSFETLFDGAAAADRSHYFLWTRAHGPSAWSPTRAVTDADARDLARMIVIASRRANTPKVELVLHSNGTIVFQRLLQLRREPEVREALRRLSGSRVVLLDGMTHYEGAEREGGPEVARLAQANRMLVGWLDSWDDLAAEVESAARAWMNPAALAWLTGYRAQRSALLAAATAPAAAQMARDLDERWAPELESARLRLRADLERDAQGDGWREALIRRSNDAFRLDFAARDARLARRLDIAVDFVHAAGDRLLDWRAARLLMERFGLAAPAKMPAAGTSFTDPTGRLRGLVVAGDHYFPLKEPGALARLLDR